MKIQLTSVMVQNQAKASQFYTETLGFIKKHDIPMGEFNWLTVISPEGHDDVELLLEPNHNPAAKVYQAALFEQGIPATAFTVTDINAEYARLTALGVEFKMPPTPAGPVTIAIFNDTCGNWIQIIQM
jgi:catechol 2,3-dioxygenase-like lactoylglutathione lyase family enzyme